MRSMSGSFGGASSPFGDFSTPPSKNDDRISGTDIAGSVLRSRSADGVACRLVPQREQKLVSASNAARHPGQMILETVVLTLSAQLLDLPAGALPLLADLGRGLV